MMISRIVFSVLERYGDKKVALQFLSKFDLFDPHLGRLTQIARTHGVADDEIASFLADQVMRIQTLRRQGNFGERAFSEALSSIGRELTSLLSRSPAAIRDWDPVEVLLSCLKYSNNPEIISFLLEFGARDKAVQWSLEVFESSGARTQAGVAEIVKAIDPAMGRQLEVKAELSRLTDLRASLKRRLENVPTKIYEVDEEYPEHPFFGPSGEWVSNPTYEADCERIRAEILETETEIEMLTRKLAGLTNG